MNKFINDDSQKENLDDLNSAINRNTDNLNINDYYKKESNENIAMKIIMIVITIILIMAIIIGIIFTVSKKNEIAKNETEDNALVPSIIENNENVTNEKIIDDSTAYLNRKY